MTPKQTVSDHDETEGEVTEKRKALPSVGEDEVFEEDDWPVQVIQFIAISIAYSLTTITTSYNTYFNNF